MANLTLRQATPGVDANPDYTYKSGPLTHNELDANFIALDSAQKAGFLDSGLTIGGGDIVLVEGGIELNGGDMILHTGDVHYDPALRFVNDIADTETVRFDSSGAVLIGSSVNSQSVNLKVARTGNQHALIGSKVSNSGQTTTLELGPAGDANNTGAGMRVAQTTGNFDDWAMFLFTSNGTDGHTDAIAINTNGTVDFRKDVTFDGDISLDGDLNITGEINVGGSPIASGTVTSVGLTAPTGMSVDNSPITSSGTLALSLDSGYSLVSDADRTLWNSGAAGGIDDAPSDGEDYVRNNGAWTVAEYSSYSAGNGISMDGNNQFSLSGSTTGEFEAVTRVTAKGTSMDGLGNAHFYMKDVDGSDRAILFHSPTPGTGALSMTVFGPGESTPQAVFNANHGSWTRLFYANDERLTTNNAGVFVNGTVGSSRISMSSDSVSDSGQFTPVVTAVDLGRAFKRIRNSILSVSTFDSLQSNLDSGLNQLATRLEALSGTLDSTDSMGSYGIV